MLTAVSPTKERRFKQVVWECKCDCGKTCKITSANLVRKLTKSCGCLAKRRAEKHPNWKGGVFKKADGYIDDYDPMSNRQRRYKLQHRKNMENHIGRKLEPFEIIHHINKEKNDNRIENLEIMTRADHAKAHIRQRDTNGRFRE